jgi:NDP-sugar pyrophosphorylase family protein
LSASAKFPHPFSSPSAGQVREGTAGACLAPIDVFVLAGGLGRRIHPLLGDTPKLLAAVAGRPYLEHLLDWLERFGVRRVVLGLGHRAQTVIEHLRARPRVDIEVVQMVEPRPLGTAGAIRFARAELRSDPVLVINGDSFVDVDLCRVLVYHRESGARGTIVCTRLVDASRYGRILVDGAGRVRAFLEKDPTFPGPALVNAGIYLLSVALLDEIAAGQAASLEHDVFARSPPGSLAAFTGSFGFIDIGTPESLAEANKSLKSLESFAGPGGQQLGRGS